MAITEPLLTEEQALIQPAVPGVTRPMTYEEYLTSPEEMARYDIIDGWKVYRLYGDASLTNPTRRHQEIALNLAEAFRIYQRAHRAGRALIAPCDVQITQRPLRTRQPDLLFISNARWAANPPTDDPAPLAPAPELAVEIVSRSDRPAVLSAKIADYRAVGVQEVWVVRAEDRTIELIALSPEEIATVGIFGPGLAVVSQAFPGLTVETDVVFEE